MLEQEGSSSQIDHGIFEVRSQTNPDQYYLVIDTGDGLVCSCQDHTENHADCKHIKVILHRINTKYCYSNHPVKIMERSKLKLCKFCDSGNIIKKGFAKNKSGNVQIFQCKECERKFTANIGFEKMRYDDGIITGAIQMYFSGMSTRDISNHYEMMGIEVLMLQFTIEYQSILV